MQYVVYIISRNTRCCCQPQVPRQKTSLEAQSACVASCMYVCDSRSVRVPFYMVPLLMMRFVVVILFCWARKLLPRNIVRPHLQKRVHAYPHYGVVSLSDEHILPRLNPCVPGTQQQCFEHELLDGDICSCIHNNTVTTLAVLGEPRYEYVLGYSTRKIRL